MNPGIFYLYEYKNNQKYRNVGFLKFIRHYNTCTLQLHARGIPVTRQDTIKLFVFYMERENAHANILTDIVCDSHAASVRLNIAENQLSDQHTFDEIQGFILRLPNNSILAATVPGITLDPQEIVYAAPKNDSSTAEPESAVSSPAPAPVPDRKQPDSQSGSPAPSSGLTPAPDKKQPDSQSDSPAPSPAPAPAPDRKQPDSQSDSPAPSPAPTPVPDKKQPDSDITATAQVPSSGTKRLEAESLDPCTPETPPEETIRKIQRSEMSVLPRRYWNLANNSFLLHGYNNYNHLLLVEKDGHYWLGVPGIYDTREARAAELFGFPQFTTSYNDKLTLSKDECSEHDNFGYWFRYLK